MAKKPANETPAATPATPAASSDSAAPAASTATPEAGAAGETAAPARKASGSSRPISYFSSVSTDEYRQGWAEIFGKRDTKSTAKARAGKGRPALPVTLELDIDDLDAEARAHLDALFRRQAKRRRLNYDKLAGNGQVAIRISCRISD